MQYTVLGSDGNQYGPVDLALLKQWVTEGRVLPDSQVTDNLSNRTMIASQMPELGLINRPSVTSNPYAAPPAAYPRPGYETQLAQPIQGTVIGSVIFRIILAVGIASLTRSGGLIVSSFTVYYAVRALMNKDPNGILCVVLALLCLAAIGGWTVYKSSHSLN
jgi:hypothetical protein